MKLVLDPLCKLSMATNTWVKSPGAVVKGPIMSKPQQAKGQDGGMVMRFYAGTRACLPKNWQLVHRRTRSLALAKAVGQ
jgi:hypothetical protein